MIKLDALVSKRGRDLTLVEEEFLLVNKRMCPDYSLEVGRCIWAPAKYELFQPFFPENCCYNSRCHYCTNAWYELVGVFVL